MASHSDDWCILRTAGRTTLRLAETLGKDGYEVWTPAEVRTLRVPRANVRREITLPIMPSYVFARAHHLIELLELERLEVKPRRGEGWGEPAHARFTVMRHADAIPLVADRHLQSLRQIEAKRAPRKKADRAFVKGVQVKVKIEGGSFAGMVGVVRRSDQGHTLVCFSDRIDVRISTFLLDEDAVGQEQSLLDNAVRKAA